MDFLLMFLTFQDICRKGDSICVLLLAETKHLCGRNQARIHSVSEWAFGEQNQLSIIFSFVSQILGHAGKVILSKLLLRFLLFKRIYIQKET